MGGSEAFLAAVGSPTSELLSQTTFDLQLTGVPSNPKFAKGVTQFGANFGFGTVARRDGRSTQTHLDADHRPLRAERDGARERRFGGPVAAVAGPVRSSHHRSARSAHG